MDRFHSVLQEEFFLLQALFLELFVFGKAGLAGQRFESPFVIAMFFQQTAIFGVDVGHLLRMRLIHRSVLLVLWFFWTREGGNKHGKSLAETSRRELL